MRPLLRFWFICLMIISCASFPGYSEQKSPLEDTFSIALEMFKWDEYLPAIDLLESSSSELNKSFNYWLYLGLAFQRTGQTERAIEAYTRAVSINPEAGNLKTRIRALKLETQRLEYKVVRLETSEEKSRYLLVLARNLRAEKKYDNAYRLFLQALSYSQDLVSDDQGFLTQGEVFYGMKKVDFSELFQGIYQYYQGNFSAAEKNIEYFLGSGAKRPSFLLARAESILQSIKASKKEIARVLQQEEQIRLEKLAKASAEKTGPGISSPMSTTTDDLTKVEDNLTAGAVQRVFQPDSGFTEYFGKKLLQRLAENLAAENDPDRQRRLIWEIGNTNVHDREVMQQLCSFLESEDINTVLITLTAISKIGMPSADIAVDSLLKLLEHEESNVKFVAIENLGMLRSQPEKVMPFLVKEYEQETDIYLKRHVYYWVNKFGRSGLQVLYNILDDKARVDRAGIAELISRITGEKIQDLIDR